MDVSQREDVLRRYGNEGDMGIRDRDSDGSERRVGQGQGQGERGGEGMGRDIGLGIWLSLFEILGVRLWGMLWRGGLVGGREMICLVGLVIFDGLGKRRF